jgi:hypothetical protein
VAKEKPLTKVPEEELTEFEREQLAIYRALPEDQKAGHKSRIERKFVRAKLTINQSEKLDELFPNKRAVGIRKAIDEYLFKHSGPKDTDVNRAWEALKREFPNTEGFDYFQGAKVIAKAMGIEEKEAYPHLDKLMREGFSRRISNGDYVVFTDRIGSELQLEEERKMLRMLKEVQGLI